jgi:hypothetical protein
LLDSAGNPHAAHGGSEVFFSNSYLKDFPDDVLRYIYFFNLGRLVGFIEAVTMLKSISYQLSFHRVQPNAVGNGQIHAVSYTDGGMGSPPAAAPGSAAGTAIDRVCSPLPPQNDVRGDFLREPTCPYCGTSLDSLFILPLEQLQGVPPGAPFFISWRN